MNTDGVNSDTFISIWQAANSVADVVKQTGTTAATASVRASRLRAAGVPLKIMGTGRRRAPRIVSRIMRVDLSPEDFQALGLELDASDEAVVARVRVLLGLPALLRAASSPQAAQVAQAAPTKQTSPTKQPALDTLFG